MSESKQLSWAGPYLPWRTPKRNYTLCIQPNPPPIKINDLFTPIKDLDALRRNLTDINKLIRSHPVCGPVIADADGRVLRDAQGPDWIWDPKTGHVTVTYWNDTVAESLPQFLSRLQVENAIWDKVSLPPKRAKADPDGFMKHFKKVEELVDKKDLEALASQCSLTSDECSYLKAMLDALDSNVPSNN